MARIRSNLLKSNEVQILGSYVSGLLTKLGIEGRLIILGGENLGFWELNILVEGTPSECFHRELNPQKKAKIIALRNGLLAEYEKTKSATDLAALKAFSNNLITLNCPRPIGPVQVRVE